MKRGNTVTGKLLQETAETNETKKCLELHKHLRQVRTTHKKAYKYSNCDVTPGGLPHRAAWAPSLSHGLPGFQASWHRCNPCSKATGLLWVTESPLVRLSEKLVLQETINIYRNVKITRWKWLQLKIHWHWHRYKGFCDERLYQQCTVHPYISV